MQMHHLEFTILSSSRSTSTIFAIALVQLASASTQNHPLLPPFFIASLQSITNIVSSPIHLPIVHTSLSI
jgi:hypothetical protein